jgi:hypothetical protein
VLQRNTESRDPTQTADGVSSAWANQAARISPSRPLTKPLHNEFSFLRRLRDVALRKQVGPVCHIRQD